jgi:hypothetical protein
LEELVLDKINDFLSEKVVPQLNSEIPIKIKQEGKDPIPLVGDQTGKVRIRDLRGLSSFHITSIVATRFFGVTGPYSATMLMAGEYLEDITASGELVPSSSGSSSSAAESSGTSMNAANAAASPQELEAGSSSSRSTSSSSSAVQRRSSFGISSLSLLSRRRRTAATSSMGSSDSSSTSDGDTAWPFRLPTLVPKIPKQLAFTIRITGLRIVAAAATATVSVMDEEMLAVDVHEIPIEYSTFTIECEHGLLGMMEVASRNLCTKMANKAADTMKTSIQKKISAQMKLEIQKAYDDKMPMKLKNKYGRMYKYASIILVLVVTMLISAALLCCLHRYCMRSSNHREFQQLGVSDDTDGHEGGLE